ncbi:MAG: MFS transporter [Anaerolineales bacterium]|nr:MAG: MFS transporter [Anaerolineales bacterium]
METSNSKQLAILGFSLVVVMLGFGMVIPIFPFYIEKLGAGGGELGLLVATAALLEFLFAPIWGSISDRVGRKPVLMVGLVGYALSSLLMGLSTTLSMLFGSRALSGVLSSATLVTAMAYVGDSTSEEDRGGGMGWLGAAMGLGAILGPGLGGLLGATSLSTPFFIAAAMSLLALLLIAFLLPESLRPEARQLDSRLRTVEARRLWRALFSPIGILLFLVFLVSFGLGNFEAVFGLYAARKFGYGPERVGAILTVIGIVTTLGKGALTGPATRRWGEALVIKASLLAGSIGFVVLLLANTYVTVLLATAFFIMSKTMLRPAVLSLTSKQATVGQGAAMGLSNSFMSLGRIIGPIWAGAVFDLNYSYPYLSGSVILLLGFLISLATVSQPAKGAIRAGMRPAADKPSS